MKSEIQQRFSDAALTYDAHAELQREVADLLVKKLHHILPSPPQSILEIGCGTGYLTRKLDELWPTSQLVGIDLALPMVEVCRQASSSGSYVVADGEHLPFDHPFDLVSSNLCLQWFQQPSQSLHQLAHLGKRMALTTFGPASFKEWHEVCAHYDLPIRTKKFLSVAMLSEILGPDYLIESQLIQKSFETWLAFWHQIRKIGAHFGEETPTKTSFKNLRTALQLKNVKVTHEIIFITSKQ
ncbi:methyltransferase domain-containing protein [Candidatus Paracaedibacter symbiosus]|uniref:methyltransferase domain-containing protein n=1 Tax=Candidatus Paracaedibacter symbiosus TaxID=244582 RepID=UPI0006907CD7|nr:methyltransferase domain-containing protein [Candidatus Paracaedibacter symbiosus]